MILQRLWVAYPEQGIEIVEEREYNVSRAFSNHRKMSMSDEVDYQAYDESEALVRMINDHQKYWPDRDLIVEGDKLKMGDRRAYKPPRLPSTYPYSDDPDEDEVPF